MRNSYLVLLLMCFVGMAFANNPPIYKGQYIVKLKNQSAKGFSLNISQIGISQVDSFSLGTSQFVVVSHVDAKSLELLAKRDDVEYIEPNYEIKVAPKFDAKNFISEEELEQAYQSSAVNDPKFGDLWGLHNTGANDPSGRIRGVEGADIDALKAWEVERGNKKIKIAIIDTGIDYTHKDLMSNIWVNEAEKNGRPGVDDDGNGYVDDIHGYDFANKDADPLDGHGHGTHCAGTIGAVHNNNLGVAGVMAEVELVAVKFLSDSGSGSTSDAIQAIDYATKVGVNLMSNSWGGGGYSQALKEAIERANEKNILFVAAAGNSNSNNDQSPHYPSNYSVDNVISVAAHNAADELASFSCYGKRTVHIAAPGRNILSTVTQNRYAVYSGTSMATPHVSGALGLLLASNSSLKSMKEIRERLMLTSEPVRAYRAKIMSSGRLNAYNLVTDTRPPRDEPTPSDWVRVALETPIESGHPYADNQNYTTSFSHAGAKFIRLVFAKVDLERNYDWVVLSAANGQVVDKVTGESENYVSQYADGDQISLAFTSDYSINKWGFKVIAYEYVK